MTVLYDYCDADGKKILVLGADPGQGIGINVRAIPVFDADAHVTPVSVFVPASMIPYLIVALSGALDRIAKDHPGTAYARVMDRYQHQAEDTSELPDDYDHVADYPGVHTPGHYGNPPRPLPCRCGQYVATSERDMDEHVAAMMHVNDGLNHGAL